MSSVENVGVNIYLDLMPLSLVARGGVFLDILNSEFFALVGCMSETWQYDCLSKVSWAISWFWVVIRMLLWEQRGKYLQILKVV